MCAHKCVVYLVHAMQTHTQLHTHTGMTEVTDFQSKSVLPEHLVLFVMCLLAIMLIWVSHAFCITVEFEEAAIFFPVCAAQDWGPAFYINAIIKNKKNPADAPDVASQTSEDFGLTLVFRLVHLRLKSSAFIPICVRETHDLFVFIVLTNKGRMTSDREQERQWAAVIRVRISLTDLQNLTAQWVKTQFLF